MNIVLLGCPGAGKGTLAQQLKHEYSYFILTPGELYRREAELKTEFGLRAKEYWGNGNLCPNEMTNELIKNTIKNSCGPNIVFDGYPRTVVQAEFLDSITNIQLIIDLHINDDISVQRLLRRREIENRPDDTEDVIRQRLAVYHKNNDAIINYYSKDANRYKFINADRPRPEVFNDAQTIIINKTKEIDNENR